MAALGPLPLAEFMASLSDLGIRATLDDQRRITIALRAGGPWTMVQFRGVLSSLLVRDRDQTAEFRRRFNAFFDSSLKDPIAPVDIERALAELRGLAEKPARRLIRPPTVSRQPFVEPNPSMAWRWSVLAALVLVLALLLQESTPSDPGKGVALPDSSTSTQADNGNGAKRADAPAQSATPRQQQIQTFTPAPVSENQESYTSLHSPVLRVKAFYPPPAPPLWANRWLLALAAVSYFLWLGRWLRSVTWAPPPSGPPGGGPRLFRTGLVGGGFAARLDRQTLDRMADALGYFRSEESGRNLDLQASVEKTVRNGGIPTPVFELRRQVRRVLILEDLHAEARAWNPIARELAIGLSRRGVPVLHGLFAGVPDRFRSPDGLDQRIEDLEDERRGYLVLIFSDGKGLGPAAADFALERLARWPQVAWMQLQDRRFWGRTAARPALRGLPIFPADRKGLLQAMAAFATERAVRATTPSPERWRGHPPRPVGGSLKLYIEEILGDSLLWAQACAMAPPPIALGLADRLRERFHPRLPPERIERLLVLPGSRLTTSGLKLDQPVLAVLREGFAQQHGDQEAVLAFLLEQMSRAEPEERESLAHQAWEWRLERIRLELDPEPAVERIAALALGPMRETIRTELGKVWSRRPDERRLPLRIEPRSRHATERLDALTEGQEVFPPALYRLRLWPEAGLAVAAVAVVALFLWRASLSTPSAVSLVLRRNTPDVPGTALVRMERRQRAEWVEVSHRVLDKDDSDFPWWPQSDGPGEARFSAFLPGAGVARKVLRVDPGTYTLELVTERRTRPCQERFPELGITVTRCRPRRLTPALQNSFVDLFKVVPKLPQRTWVAKIGIESHSTEPGPGGEIVPAATGRPGILGDVLLASDAVNILYTVSGSDTERAAAMAWIQERWRPWTRQVRLISWQASYARRSDLSQGSLADWPDNLQAIPQPPPAAAKNMENLLKTAEELLKKPPADAEPSQVVAAAGGSPAGDEPTVSELIQAVPQELTDRGETPVADQPQSCQSPGLSRCGDACVDLETNPFHYGACFAVAHSLSRAAAEKVDSPPPWTEETIRRRRYYRLFYAWNDSKSSVIGRSLSSQSSWNRGDAPDAIELVLSSSEIAGAGYALAITDLEIHCSDQARVASINSEGREMYEKLSTQSNWKPFKNLAWRGNWRGPSEMATDSGLTQSLGSTLDTWETVCKRED